MLIQWFHLFYYMLHRTYILLLPENIFSFVLCIYNASMHICICCQIFCVVWNIILSLIFVFVLQIHHDIIHLSVIRTEMKMINYFKDNISAYSGIINKIPYNSQVLFVL
jgi:hypothetical protein